MKKKPGGGAEDGMKTNIVNARPAAAGKYLSSRAAANAVPEGVALVTTAQLAHLVTTAVTAALEEALGDGLGRAVPKLLDRSELARVLGVSAGLVDKFRRQGMPCIYLGDSPRFEVEPCYEWLRREGRQP